MSQAVGADPWDESMGCRICKNMVIELVEYEPNWPGGDIRREDIRMPELPVIMPEIPEPTGPGEVVGNLVTTQVNLALLESEPKWVPTSKWIK